MANELLKTLTIGGVSLDILEVGNFLKSGNGKIVIPFENDFVTVTKSIPNNSSGNHELWTSPITGWAIISYYVEFPASSNGSRYSALWNITDDSSPGASQRGTPAATGTTIHTGCVRQWLNEGRKMGIRVYQNSGSALNCKLQLHILYVSRDNE